VNSDMNDAQPLAAQTEAVPAELRTIHQRLLDDGAHWRNDLPLVATRSTQVMPETGMVTERGTVERRERATVLAQPPTMPRRDVSWARRLVASAAIIVVVGLLAALFATFARGRGEVGLTSAIHDSTQTPTWPASTPGPAAKYIVNVVTARSVDSNFAPIDITSHFPVNSQVHRVIQVRNLTAGEKHTVSVRWFLNGIDTQVKSGPGRTSVDVKDNSNVHVALLYPTTGVGMAKIYWDRPANDNSDSTSDPSLARTIYFAVEQPTPTPSV
jgi:hypothetical protein